MPKYSDRRAVNTSPWGLDSTEEGSVEQYSSRGSVERFVVESD